MLLVLSLGALAAALTAAVARRRWLPEAIVAPVGAVVLIAAGAITVQGARHALGELGPTVGFLAALLVLAEGCRREGVFAAIGAWMAGGSRGEPRRLLGLTFVAGAGVTAVLGLDATVVLLTPVLFLTAARLRVDSKPHAYACVHLANSASLLLVVSNLTNLLAFHLSRISFVHFAALMALPWLGAIAVEWVAITRFFGRELRQRPRAAPAAGSVRVPRFALCVVALTLVGFALSSTVGVATVWFAIAGAVAISIPGLRRGGGGSWQLVRAIEPGFLLFVLALGVIVAAASQHGLDGAVRSVLPAGESLPDLLLVAVVSAVLANLVNNLPATLILLPVTAALGTGPLLAMLVGVNVGPNLTYVGSLATLLWRRVLHAERTDVQLGEFSRLGLLTVPVSLLLCTTLVWVSVLAWG